MSTAAKRLTEVEKAELPDQYVLNPASGKYVKRTSTLGKSILAEKIPLTGNAYVLKMVQHIAECCDISSDEMYDSLKSFKDSTGQELPSNFPRVWGGKEIVREVKPPGSSTPKPVKPKEERRVSSLILFREEYKQKNPSAETKTIDEAWKKMSDNEKAKFVEEAKKINASRMKRCEEKSVDIEKNWHLLSDSDKKKYEKADDKADYIFNYNTNKIVKKDSTTGKKLLKEVGEIVSTPSASVKGSDESQEESGSEEEVAVEL
jgi:hypothetical protein